LIVLVWTLTPSSSSVSGASLSVSTSQRAPFGCAMRNRTRAVSLATSPPPASRALTVPFATSRPLDTEKLVISDRTLILPSAAASAVAGTAKTSASAALNRSILPFRISTPP
jgi:hypothetical protein